VEGFLVVVCAAVVVDSPEVIGISVVVGPRVVIDSHDANEKRDNSKDLFGQVLIYQDFKLFFYLDCCRIRMAFYAG